MTNTVITRLPSLKAPKQSADYSAPKLNHVIRTFRFASDRAASCRKLSTLFMKTNLTRFILRHWSRLAVLLLTAFGSVAQAATAGVAVQPLRDPTVTDNYANGSANGLTAVMGSHTYFVTGDSSGSTHNLRLWVTDGTAASTSMVKDLGITGSASSLISNGTLLFFTTAGTDLWRSDGTSAGTFKVPGVGGATGTAGGRPNSPIIVGTDLWFNADSTGLNGGDFQFYKYTGSGSAVKMTSFNTFASTFSESMINVNVYIFYTSASSISTAEIYRYDPSNGNIVQVTSFGGASGANASQLNVSGTSLFFVASDYSDLNSTNPRRHWYRVESDTTGLKNLTPAGYTASGSNTFRKVGSTYYMIMTDSSTIGNQIWKMDGVTVKGATLFSNQDGSHNGNFISAYEVFGTKLYFSGAFGGTTGTEPGYIDTTDSTGTAHLLLDIFSGASNSSPSSFVVSGSRLYFNATTAASTIKMFQSDGTTAGTSQILAINSGGSDAPSGNIAIGNLLYFRAQTASSPASNSRLPCNLVNVSVAQGDGQTAGVSSAFATALQINVKDTAGVNNLSGVAVTFSPPASGAGGSFSSSATVTTDASGNATAPTFTANSTQGSYTVKVLLNGIDTGVAFTLTNGASSPAPTISSVTGPSAGSYKAGQDLSFTANFSAAVTVTGTPYLPVNVGGSPVHANYASGSGGTALVFTYTVQAGDTDADGIASSSPLVLNSGTIKGSGGTDVTLTFTPPTTTSVFVDTTAPTVGIGSPSAPLTSGGPVTFTVTYSGQNSITLANGNVTLNTTGNANATVGVSGSGSTRTVTLSGITGDGTLGISIAAGTASDPAGNSAAAAGPSTTFTVDNTAPGISIGSPAVSLTSGGPVSFTVTYSGENSITLANANVTLNTTGNANATVAVSGTGSTRTVTLSGITGDGTLGISIASGTASDTAGNTAGAAGPSTTFTVDNTAPTVSISAPSASTTTTGPVTYTVTYSGENGITLGNGDITLNKTGSADAGSVAVTGTGSTRTVTLSSLSGVGTLGISVASGTASDTVGNLASAAGPSTTFDVVPRVQSSTVNLANTV